MIVFVLVGGRVEAHLYPDVDDLPWSGDSGIVSWGWQDVCLSEQG